MTTTKPLIGVTTKYGNDAWVQKNTIEYLNILTQMGATPVVLSPDLPTTLPDGTVFVPDDEGRLSVEIIERLDGLILSGGGDVHPRYFGQEIAGAEIKSINIHRDELELGLARTALAADLPLFAICRGFQLLNVAAGGGMVQDLPNHRSPKEAVRMHSVSIAPASRLRRLVGENALDVNTYHHQGVDLPTLAPLFQSTAQADPDTWLIEAYESPDHRWVIGVQWHPERLFELPAPHRALWQDFLQSTR